MELGVVYQGYYHPLRHMGRTYEKTGHMEVQNDLPPLVALIHLEVGAFNTQKLRNPQQNRHETTN